MRGKEYDAVAVQKDFLSFTTGWTHRQDEEFSLEPSGNTVEISENLLTKYWKDDDRLWDSHRLHSESTQSRIGTKFSTI